MAAAKTPPAKSTPKPPAKAPGDKPAQTPHPGPKPSATVPGKGLPPPGATNPALPV